METLSVGEGKRGGARRGAGRKIAGIGKKTINMSIRISPEEKAMIDAKAKEAGMPTSRFIIKTILDR